MFKNEGGCICYKGPDPIDGREAMAISIEKWTFIAKLILGGDEVICDGGSGSCGLCIYYQGDGDCGDCPVKLDGHDTCMDTPYEKFCQYRTATNALLEVEYLKGLRDD